MEDAVGAFVVVNDDITPVLTITAGEEAVVEITDAMAEFTIISDQKPRTPLTIRYTPTSTDFLASGVSGVTVETSQPLGFAANEQGDYVCNFESSS